MKKIMLVVLVVLLVGAVSVSVAQVKISLGPKLGLNMANLSFDPDFGVGLTKSSRTGFVGGAAFEMMFSGVPLGIEADLFYAMGGCELSANGGSATWSVDAIQIPVLFKGKFATPGIISPYAYAGPALALVTTAKVKGSGGEEDVKDHMSSTDFQLLLGAGAEFKVESKIGVTFDIRYALGLTDLDKDTPGDPAIKSRGLMFLVGAMFYL
jgi:opacity protein-like surface antigen